VNALSLIGGMAVVAAGGLRPTSVEEKIACESALLL
jgi:hypothetical protein